MVGRRPAGDPRHERSVVDRQERLRGCVRVSEWSLQHLEPLLRLGTPVVDPPVAVPAPHLVVRAPWVICIRRLAPGERAAGRTDAGRRAHDRVHARERVRADEQLHRDRQGPRSERGHRVVFAAEASWKGRLEPLGFEEDLVDLAPPPDDAAAQDAGQFWTDFIIETAPEFRKPTIEQLATFIEPVWASLIDGAAYCEPQLRGDPGPGATPT